jgi:hypothetical protein
MESEFRTQSREQPQTNASMSAAGTPLGHAGIDVLKAPKASRSIVAMALLACAMFAYFFFYLLLVPQTPGRMERASAGLFDQFTVWQWVTSLGWPLPTSPAQAVLIVVVVSTLGFIGFSAAVWLAWRPATIWVRRIALIGGVVFLSLPLIALPNQQTDIWDYVAFGRVSAVHGESPYDVAPSAFPDDPLYEYASPQYREHPDNKLPAWTLISTVLAGVAGSDPVTALMTYRVSLWLMNMASLLLIILITKQIGHERQAAGIVLWAWDPIVVIWGLKTDALMVLLLLVAAVISRRHRSLAVAPLAVSALVKLITLPLILMHFVSEARNRGLARAAASVFVVLVIAAATYAPFYRDPSLLVAHARLLSRGGSSLPEFLRPIAIVLFAGFLIWLGWTKAHDARSVLVSWAVALLVSGILFTVPGLPWYLMTLTAAVAVAGEGWLVAVLIPVSLASFLINARDYLLTSHFVTDAFPASPRGVFYAGAAALLVVAATKLYPRLTRRKS